MRHFPNGVQHDSTVTGMASTPYRMPVIISLHDIEVPKHLDLHKRKGPGTITITRPNARRLFLIRLAATSPPTAAQLRKRRDIMASFAARQHCPDCQKPIVLDNDNEPTCTDCRLVLYPPPSAYLTQLARSYLNAARDVRSRSAWSSQLTRIFLAHHSAELYLKALGACSAFANDSREEYLFGDTFSYTQHDLQPLLRQVDPATRARLSTCLNGKGHSADDLVNSLPKSTSELFRYGVLLRDATRREVRTTVGGDVVMGKTNLTTLLDDLCVLLDAFTTAELNLLQCSGD